MEEEYDIEIEPGDRITLEGKARFEYVRTAVRDRMIILIVKDLALPGHPVVFVKLPAVEANIVTPQEVMDNVLHSGTGGSNG